MPITRSKQFEATPILSWGGIELDMHASELRRMGRRTHVSPKELALLQLLMSNVGVEFSREEIVAHLWVDPSQIDVRTVDVMIGRIRRALNRGYLPDPISTVRGRGYKLDEGFAESGGKALPIKKMKLRPPNEAQ